MGLPQIIIRFKTAGGTAIRRSAPISSSEDILLSLMFIPPPFVLPVALSMPCCRSR